jgi:hypothetical protein
MAAAVLGTSLLALAPASIAAAAPATSDSHVTTTNATFGFHRTFEALAFYPDNALAIARGKMMWAGCEEEGSFVRATALPSPDRYRAVVFAVCGW